MIVPQNRLLGWVALLLVPLSLLAAVEPAATVLAGLVMAGFAAVVGIDAFRAHQAGGGLTVELPRVSRFSKDKESRLEVRLRNPDQLPRTIRIGLLLPPHLESPEEDIRVSLPRGTEFSRLDWVCTPRRRGRFQIPAAFLEFASPLGFWAARRSIPTQAELRVYPNLARDRRGLAALFLNRGFLGLHAQRQVGKGRDFEKLRDYIPGDSFDEIHWKATARRGRPVTKVFQIEKTQEVYLVLDTSRLSAREFAQTGTDAPKDTATVSALERFMTAALVVGLAAEHQGDLFGLLTFSDKVDSFVRARNGKAHYSACRDTLYTINPKIVTPDFDEVCTFIRLRLRRRALLIFLTSLDDPVISENFVRNVDLIRRQHLVLVNMIQPPGLAPVFSRPDVTSVDDLYQHLGGHLLWDKLRELEKVLQRRGVRFSLLQNEQLTAELVSQYLTVKQRQIL